MHDILVALQQQILVAVATSALTAGAALVVAAVQKDRRLANLATVVEVADEALAAALKACTGPGVTRQQILSYALVAAKRVIVADRPKLVAALEAELEQLILGRQAQQLAPGGSVVNLPSPVPGGAA